MIRFRNVILPAFAGAGMFGGGLAIGHLANGGHGDPLAFAGALVGAAFAVAGAFAVADRSENNARQRARDLLIHIAASVRDDMDFLLNLQRIDVEASLSMSDIARRVDRIASGLPEIADFLPVERLGSKSGSMSTLAAELKFQAALKVAKPAFVYLDSERREFRQRLGEWEDVTCAIRPDVLKELRDAAALAAKEL